MVTFSVDALGYPLISKVIVELLQEFEQRGGKYQHVANFATGPRTAEALAEFEVRHPDGHLLPISAVKDLPENEVRLISHEGRLLCKIVNIGG